MANRSNQVKSVVFADIGGGNTLTLQAHQLSSLEITPAHPRTDTFAGTQIQPGQQHNISIAIRAGDIEQINAVKEVLLGLVVDGSGLYQEADDSDLATTRTDWVAVGKPQVDGVSHDIAVATTTDTDLLPLLVSFTPSGYLGLRELSSAQATALDARTGRPTDIALRRSDDTYLVLREVYPHCPLSLNTGQGAYIVRELAWRRMKTRDLETYLPYLAADATVWPWFADRMLADTRIELTARMIDNNTETVKFAPVGFTVRPVLNFAGGVFDHLLLEGVAYGTTSGYLTLAPSLS